MVTTTTFSESGGHPINEDAFLAHAHPAALDCWLGFLADGQGGRAGGAEAASLACRTAADAAAKRSSTQLYKPTSWEAVLQEADHAVACDPHAGFTTLIGFCIKDDYLVGASSGDSAVLVVNGGQAVEVTASQQKNPPVGSGSAQFIPFALPLAKPWLVMAMSDGVWKYVGWNRVVQAATEHRGHALIEALCRAAKLPGSGKFQDDFTMVIFEEKSGP